MSRRAVPIILLAFLLAAAPAQAAKSPKKAIWGPVEVDGESQFPIYKDLGAGVFQMTLKWDETATVAPEDGADPDDTAYDGPAEIDTAISEGKRTGIKIALTVAGTPGWANGEKARTVPPKKAADLADFLTAASKHYKAVRIWSIWDEKVSPASSYPKMLDAAYVALHKVSKQNRVIGGNGNTNLKKARMDYLAVDVSATKAPTKKQLAALEKKAGSSFIFLGTT
jgi:hypothetical protein